ncbi:HAD-IG family 5'-nucleotidase [Sorangium sp. So ce1389]|uniref:HAD-IG family 5'-nucleotidase n=1 Tax=Sorangium sp. So ce1389 TaxID=3133336 RepID=UPI003F6333B4
MDKLDCLSAPPPKQRGIFCNRTLNLRSIKAIGYDMDYTLIHYRVEAWERRAYEHLRHLLESEGWPVGDLTFEPDLVSRGLILDTELGNLLKVNRFGYVKRAYHGTKPIDFETQRSTYARTIVDLADGRYVFLNTLFSLSEGCMYAKLVDLLDQRRLPEVLGYSDLYGRVKDRLDATHMEGQLKAEIIADPDRFVLLDPETPLTLLDQKEAGKKLVLITNSEWVYTRAMMSYAFDRFLPDGMTWRELFDVVIVSARKPEFFSSRSPLFEVVTEDGLLRPAGRLREGGHYLGGNAGLVEHHLRLSGDEILYIGDHIYGDVHVSKSVLRWRTALIIRELEDEILAIEEARGAEARLDLWMREKEDMERVYARLRLELQRMRAGYGPVVGATEAEVQAKMNELKTRLAALDARIAPLAKASAEALNPRWGLLLRTGNDKSHLARQIERSADIYTSRVSNFLLATPHVLLRSHRGSLPHDPMGAPPGADRQNGEPAPVDDATPVGM